jgi:putative FmdB family regulatory protein
MPTYDYQCQACGHRLEVFQSFSEAPKRKCPQCGKQRLERLIGTGAGVLFKGSGFYQTDYRSDSYRKGASAESKSAEPADDAAKPAADKTSSGGDAKPDTPSAKPAAAPASKPAKKRDKSS